MLMMLLNHRMEALHQRSKVGQLSHGELGQPVWRDFGRRTHKQDGVQNTTIFTFDRHMRGDNAAGRARRFEGGDLDGAGHGAFFSLRCARL